NQGNSANATNNSRSPTKSQNPCCETLVTSTGEVLGPGAAELMGVLLNQFQCLGQAPRLEPVVPFDLHCGLEPELGLALGVLHVHVRSRLFAREEVEAIAADPKDGRTHRLSIAQRASRHR